MGDCTETRRPRSEIQLRPFPLRIRSQLCGRATEPFPPLGWFSRVCAGWNSSELVSQDYFPTIERQKRLRFFAWRHLQQFPLPRRDQWPVMVYAAKPTALCEIPFPAAIALTVVVAETGIE